MNRYCFFYRFRYDKREKCERVGKEPADNKGEIQREKRQDHHRQRMYRQLKIAMSPIKVHGDF